MPRLTRPRLRDALPVSEQGSARAGRLAGNPGRGGPRPLLSEAVRRQGRVRSISSQSRVTCNARSSGGCIQGAQLRASFTGQVQVAFSAAAGTQRESQGAPGTLGRSPATDQARAELRAPQRDLDRDRSIGLHDSRRHGCTSQAFVLGLQPSATAPPTLASAQTGMRFECLAVARGEHVFRKRQPSSSRDWRAPKGSR